MASRKPPYDHGTDEIEINAGRPTVTLRVSNLGDRPVQVGSHFHFFEVNRVMRFEREQAWGMHLDIAAGTGVRFEPGETKEVTLTAFAGRRHVMGFNGLVNGGLDARQTKITALARLAELGFEDGAARRAPKAASKSTSKSASKSTSKSTSKPASKSTSKRAAKKGSR